MSNRRNIITLNGNRYDAVTGQLLDEIHKPKTTKKVEKNSFNMEGFVNKPSKNSHSGRSTHNISRTTHKSKTLMRKVVNKPIVKQVPGKPLKTTITKPVSINPSRELRAKEINKSSLISRFGSTISGVSKNFSELPITAPPETMQKQKIATNKNNFQSQQHSLVSTNNKKLYENALKNAKSHDLKKQKSPSKTSKIAKNLKIKPGFLNISLFVLAGILLAGYFAYNNIPNLAMKIASSRSGISGTVPGYQASGYSFRGPLAYKTGEIKIAYKSNSDNRSYEVIERNSEWNSDALLSNHVATNGRTYQILQEKGKTIYIYDGYNASWVDNGIWYEIKGGEALSANQVIKIANSL